MKCKKCEKVPFGIESWIGGKCPECSEMEGGLNIIEKKPKSPLPLSVRGSFAVYLADWKASRDT